MAMSQAASLLEKALGHGDNAVTEQDVTNPGRDREKFGDPSGEKMKALCWMGKNDVQVCQYTPTRYDIGIRKLIIAFVQWKPRSQRLSKTAMSY